MFRPIHRRICLAYQIVCPAVGRGENRNTDTGSHMEFIDIDTERLANSLKHGGTQLNRAFFGKFMRAENFIRNNQKFIPPQASDQIPLVDGSLQAV